MRSLECQFLFRQTAIPFQANAKSFSGKLDKGNTSFLHAGHGCLRLRSECAGRKPVSESGATESGQRLRLLQTKPTIRPNRTSVGMKQSLRHRRGRAKH
ncbi:hypothetical protein HMPREF1981_02391 [Bacteroides pyogenes F0041]|uniref:Uncharacterized protein n=1 Tax=Bacteroides pyogenes F0041 TaxID=1321819 RepID=U2CIS2_9BACE|nr:hypothetical protein HMPREF1981_02391 [Bacteroides pyogenes F0041]